MSSELKQRKKGKSKSKAGHDSNGGVGKSNGHVKPQEVTVLPGEEISSDDVIGLARVVWIFLGALAMCYTGYWFAWYIEVLHENNLWFSNIREVEREISFRTECGLYYSYFKQAVEAPSISQSWYDLQHDNATEHGRTINVLERFNIHQEVILAWIYRTFDFARYKKPIFFYVQSIFRLNGFYVSVLFGLSWYLTGTWLAGVVAVLQFILNLDDATRVFFTINLRESFALPFLYAQMAAVCLYLRAKRGKETIWRSSICLLLILTLSFVFSMSWQFSQFVLLMQCGALYGLYLFQLAPLNKLTNLMLILAASQICVWYGQYYNEMVLGSLILSFVPVCIANMWLLKNLGLTGGILEGGFRIVFQCGMTAVETLLVNHLFRRAILVEADAHIFKFLKGKFGFGNMWDFESRLYLCHGAFIFLSNDFFLRTSLTGLFPMYLPIMLGSLFLIGKNVLLEWVGPPGCVNQKSEGRNGKIVDVSDKPFFLNQRPAYAYLVIQSVVFGVIALMTERMKYLWTPVMCVLAAVGVGSYDIWESMLGGISNKLKKKHLIEIFRGSLCLAVCAFAAYRLTPLVQTQLDDLREFWDPDTVELMEWIGNSTKPDASFGGSMQLLAGVKCCTARHLTNHPHFEDKWLRERTKQVYQIYGRRNPEDVHKILIAIGADYIILEDSICLARSTDNCRLPDIIDIDNGHKPDSGLSLVGLRKEETPRFCDEIRYGSERFSRLFKKVMENATFRVYRVLKKAQDNKEKWS